MSTAPASAPAHDLLGNALAGAALEVVAAIDDFVAGFLGYETRIERVLPAADAHPNEILLNVYAGFVWLFLESPAGPTQAQRYLEAAARVQASAGSREQLHVELLRAWIADDIPGALRLADAITDDHPRDLAIVKLQQYLEFNRGNSPQMLRAILKVLDANREVAWAQGLAAFAYEQCHLLAEAEQAARRAIALKRKEPWAQHALAHVLLTQGRIREGTAFLESVRDTWVDLTSFMLTHNWWHLAVFHLARGRLRDVLAIYDQHVWGVAKSYSQDQVGAVQLLARIELDGHDVGPRWQDVAAHIAARGADTEQPFLSLLYLYGLGRAGRPEADVLLAAIERRADEAPEHSRAVWHDVTVPAARGVLAHARGDFEGAWRGLTAALPGLVGIGGSHAQRDLFNQLQLSAARRSGRLVAVQQDLELRRNVDPENVPVNLALADVYAALDLPGLATQARERAHAALVPATACEG